MKTKKDYSVSYAGTCMGVFYFPAGTKCVRATNQPLDKNGEKQYFLSPKRGVKYTNLQMGWIRAYGILVSRSEIF